jgi:hypothetical protein
MDARGAHAANMGEDTKTDRRNSPFRQPSSRQFIGALAQIHGVGIKNAPE